MIDKKSLMDKYGFLILMLISAFIFTIYIGTKDIKDYKIAKAEKEVTEQRDKNKVVQNNTGEIQIIPPESQTINLSNQQGDNGETQSGQENPTIKFTTVDDTYLEGALFIGDSRTQTISIYGDWDKTTFYAEQGVSVWKILDEKLAKIDGKKVTVKKALSKRKFDKIYIMLGINELGTGTAQTFAEQFRKVVQTIRDKQPESLIFIESIMHITKEKDESNDIIKNKEINKRNKELKKIANGIDIFWIDENEVFDKGRTGFLDPKYTSDGIHLTPSCLPKWKKFFLEHGIVK